MMPRLVDDSQRLCARPARAAAVAAVALVALAGCRRVSARRPPNVVIVVLDTLRPDRLGCYGSERDTSPNLDAMSEEFFLFENAQSSAPWTAPALISLVTSLNPDVHAVTSSPIPGRLSERARTLAEVLSRHGFQTAAITEGGYARGDFGLDRGFELFLADDGLAGGSAQGAEQRPLDTNLTRAIDWLAARGEAPFFLFFHTYEVHAPRIPPEEHVRRFRPDYDAAAQARAVRAAVAAWNERRELSPESARLIQLEIQAGAFGDTPSPMEPGLLRERARELGVQLERERMAESPELVDLVRDLYDAELRRTDEALSRLWRTLRENGLWDDTLVVLVSDHGEGLGDHGRLGHGTQLYDEVLRTLLMIHAPLPGLTPRRLPDVVRAIDLMPTLLELSGVPADGLLLQGQSLVPLMRGEPSALDAFSHAVKARRGESPQQHTIRSGHWRLIRDSSAGTVRLYDLTSDPGETLDRAGQEPEVVQRLVRRLERQRAVDAALREHLGGAGAAAELDPAVLRRLADLGYIGGDSAGAEADE